MTLRAPAGAAVPAGAAAVVDGGLVYDAELVSRLPAIFPDVTAEVVDATDFIEGFEAPAPDDRFASLQGFGFAPHFVDDLQGFKGLRLHYLDEGPADAPRTFLCLHGNPSWSYLWRKMIPVFTASGARVVAPDLPGFGRSDQPLDDAVHTFHFHRDVLLAFLRQLDLKTVTLVCQDWGGILGLTLPHAEPARFARLLVMNTTLATGDVALPEGFQAWRAWSNAQADMDVPRLFARMAPMASAEERAAYGAPFPDRSHKAALRRFPNMVPDSLDAEGAAWLDVKREVMDRYNDDLQAAIDGVDVWQASCNGYYRAPSGRIVTQWPYNFTEYRSRTERDDLSSFDTGRAPAAHR